jgi:hypothetical protein
MNLQEFTVAGWFYFNSVSSTVTLAGAYEKTPQTLGDGGWLFRWHSTLGLNFGHLIGSTWGNSSVAWTPTAGQWYHLAVSRNSTGSEIKFYVNGSQQGTTQSRTGTIVYVQNGGTTTFTIGSALYNNSVQQVLDGKIDQVRIFNRALDETNDGEVTTLYNESNTSTTKSTTDIFDDGSGVALYEFEKGAKDTGGSFGSLVSSPEMDLDVDGYTSGSISDLSGNSYTATLNGNTTYGTDSNGGGYFDFDGTGDYLSVDQTIGGSFSGDFTLEFIIEPHETGNFTYVYAKQNASTNGLLIGNFGGSNSNIEIYRYNTSGTNILTGSFTSTGITADEWQHIAIVFTATTAKLYRNGSQVSSTLTGSAVTYPADFTEFYIGGNYSSSFDLNGRVGDFRVHSSALSDSQVLQNFYASKGEYGLRYDGTPTNVSFVGTSFQPDFVWIKHRTNTYYHALFDSVRGIYPLHSNTTGAEDTAGILTLGSYDSNGFTTGNDNGTTNGNGDSYVAWCWKAGGAAVSNTDGSITSTVSANQDAGFSIVKYDGATNATTDTSNNGGSYWNVGHGLSSPPEMVIVKKTNNAGGWYVGFNLSGVGSFDIGSHLVLNTTAAKVDTTSDILWGNQNPTSTTFGLGGWDVVNRNGDSYIAYCFHSVDGYQKVGSYTGGSANKL